MRIRVLNSDVAQVPADLLVLKYADGYYGADKAIAAALKFNSHVSPGGKRFVRGENIAAEEVLFLGVGPLHTFRYERIQEFGQKAVRLASESRQKVNRLALTVHGPGYGLDPEEAFLSMIAGIVNGWKSSNNAIEEIIISEISRSRCELLNSALKHRCGEFGVLWDTRTETALLQRDSKTNAISDFGAHVEAMPRLFVAMPFSEEFQDVFEFGFHEAARRNGFVCERLDFASFTGDIVSEIKIRIVSSAGVIALLDTLNPNVFLEIGFAWAHEKPTILVAKNEVVLPFDVRGHRCIFYRNLVNLRDALSAELDALKNSGVLVGTP
jgi:hypothetical protein